MRSFGYHFPVSRCKVIDKPLLRQFREKRKEWLKKLHGRDFHAIFGQLTQLAWKEAVYRTVVEAIKFRNAKKTRNMGINEAVFNLLKEGFFRDQATAIRRITDPQDPLPYRKIVSLLSIVEDMEQHSGLFTRENYVSHNGIPYDYHPMKMNFLRTSRGAGSLPTKGPKAWTTSELLHKKFDKFSGRRSPNRRARKDLIKIKWFQKIMRRLTYSKDIKEVRIFTNKFIAHSAHCSNRPRINLTLKKIERCQKNNIRSCRLFKCYLFIWSLNGYPVAYTAI